MGKSYDNTIVEEEVSLAIEGLLLAPEDTAWTPAKIDIGSPPTGFVNLGAVVEDSPTITVTKEKYQLILGLPKALQFEAIIGVAGEASWQVYAKSNDIARRALGVDIVTISGGTRVPLGTTQLNKYSILGVADLVDGTQIVHSFPEVSAKAEFTEEVRPDDACKLTLGFDAYSYISTIHGDDRIVGERFYFD